MARPLRLDVPDALYHVLARGNQRRSVFRDDTDFRRYLGLLSRYQRRDGFLLYACVLMPNHVHLLISPQRTRLAQSMQSIQQSYTQYFNARHHLVGHCFQGRYKAILCDADAYLLQLVRYIHTNPVRAGLADTCESYPWSSHRLYQTGRDTDGVSVEAILARFSPLRAKAIAAYDAFMREGLSEGHRPDLYTVVSRRFLGDERFAQRMEKQGRPQTPKPPVRLDLPSLMLKAAGMCGLPAARLHEGDRSRAGTLSRAVVAYIAHEEGAIPLAQIAQHLNRDPATISIAVSRLRERMEHDRALAAHVDRLRRSVRHRAPRKYRKQIIKA